MLGITNHSKVPLRIATMSGFALSLLSLVSRSLYLVAKLLFWSDITLGLAPALVGIYFFGAVQLFFIGILGEYIGSIHTQVHRRPLVVERERINFEGRPERRSPCWPAGSCRRCRERSPRSQGGGRGFVPGPFSCYTS